MDLLRLLGLKKTKPNKRPCNLAFEYGTHLPVLQAILEVFQPQGVLELGAGKFSTPLFYHYGKTLVTLETDAKWFGEVARTLPGRKGFSLIHHDVGRLTSRSRTDSIPIGIKHDCVGYYREIIARHPELDFLFIDHVSGLRAFTLSSLYDEFNFVVYHDAEDKGYRYEEFATVDNGKFIHLVLQAFIPHTGILIRKDYSSKLAEFERALDRNALAYFTSQYRFELRDLTRTQQRKAV